MMDDQLAGREDITAFSPYIYGQQVRLVRTWFNGEIAAEHLPPLDAAVEMQFDERNGTEIVSAHIEFGKLLDGWGGSP